MGLAALKKYHELLAKGYFPKRIGFDKEISAGEINRFATRMRLVRSFEGLRLAGYSPPTVVGYDAFMRVFLTHSALEGFMRVYKIKNVSQIEPRLSPYEPEKVITLFREKDSGGHLFNFLHEHVNDGLKSRLQACRDGNSQNVGHISAAIRHIFAHGELCANGNGINPRNANAICDAVSEHLLTFMDSEFSNHIEREWARVLGPTTAPSVEVES